MEIDSMCMQRIKYRNSSWSNHCLDELTSPLAQQKEYTITLEQIDWDEELIQLYYPRQASDVGLCI